MEPLLSREFLNLKKNEALHLGLQWVFNIFGSLAPTFAIIGGVMLRGYITLLFFSSYLLTISDIANWVSFFYNY